MFFVHKFISGLLCAVLVTVSVAKAEPAKGIDKVDQKAKSQIQRDVRRALQRYLSEFFRLAEDEVLTQDILENAQRRMLAQQRARTLANFLGFDLDGDGALSAGEIHSSPAVGSGFGKPRLLVALYLFDENGDGHLSQAELSSAVDAEIPKNRLEHGIGLHLLQFDLDDDGSVTANEIIATVDAVRRTHQEDAATRNRKQTQGKTQHPKRSAEAMDEHRIEVLRRTLKGTGLPEACNYPEKSEAAIVKWISANSGQALSSVAISGVQKMTMAARLDILEGAAPYYLVVGAKEPMVWIFTGDLSRVERVVTHSGNAVLGLPPEKIHFTRPGVCAPGPSDLGTRVANRVFEDSLKVAFMDWTIKGHPRQSIGAQTYPGFRPIIGALQTTGIREPVSRRDGIYDLRDGAMEKLSIAEGVRRLLQAGFERKFPFGVMDVDSDALVLNGEAQIYDVLPAEAGLLQMLESGALRAEAADRLVITRPISSLPAGLREATNSRPGQLFFVDSGVELNYRSGNLHAFNYADAETGGCPVGFSCGIGRSSN